jgi:hypothetical protein
MKRPGNPRLQLTGDPRRRRARRIVPGRQAAIEAFHLEDGSLAASLLNSAELHLKRVYARPLALQFPHWFPRRMNPPI